MNGHHGYAVFFFDQALDVLGEAVKPYLHDSPAGRHVQCHEIDTGGALLEMTLHGRTPEGGDVTLELMVPTSMVRMVVSTQGDGSFGFGPRTDAEPARVLPVIGPTAPAADAPSEALPSSAQLVEPPAT